MNVFQEINFIFTTLDSDGSGRIDREEFLSGFQNALCQGENHGRFYLYIFFVICFKINGSSCFLSSRVLFVLL